MSDFYQDLILDEAAHPSHFGELKNADKTHTEHNASCGDLITVFIKLDPEKNQIEQLSWTGQGCTISLASMSLLSQNLIGKTIREAIDLSQDDLLKLIGLPTITTGRIKCLNLGLKAVQKALS